jgi:hypothetical protein
MRRRIDCHMQGAPQGDAGCRALRRHILPVAHNRMLTGLPWPRPIGISMQVFDEWNWGFFDFVFAGAFLSGVEKSG